MHAILNSPVESSPILSINHENSKLQVRIFADDGAIEFPYFGSVHLPTRFQGPEALRQFFAPVVEAAENFKLKEFKIFPKQSLSAENRPPVANEWRPEPETHY